MTTGPVVTMDALMNAIKTHALFSLCHKPEDLNQH